MNRSHRMDEIKTNDVVQGLAGAWFKVLKATNRYGEVILDVEPIDGGEETTLQGPADSMRKVRRAPTMEDRAARGADAQARRFGRRGNQEAAAQWADEKRFWQNRGGRP